MWMVERKEGRERERMIKRGIERDTHREKKKKTTSTQFINKLEIFFIF